MFLKIAQALFVALLMACTANPAPPPTPTPLAPHTPTTTPTSTPLPAPICVQTSNSPLPGRPTEHQIVTAAGETSELLLNLDPNLVATLSYQVESDGDAALEFEGPDGESFTLESLYGEVKPWLAGRYALRLKNLSEDELSALLRLETTLARELTLPYTVDLEVSPQIVRDLATPGLRLLRMEIPSGKSVALTLMVPAGLETLSYSVVSAEDAGLHFTILAPDHRTLDQASACPVHQGRVSFEHPGPHVLLLDNVTGSTLRSTTLLVQTTGPPELLVATPTPAATVTPTARPLGTPSPSATSRPGTATPTASPTPFRTPTPTPITAATPALTTSTLSLPEFGTVGEHIREVTVPRSQGLRLVIPIDERRVSRVQWWSETLSGAGAVRFQVISPDGALLDHGAIGVLNFGAFPIVSAGSYALLLENPGSVDRTFRFTIWITGR